LAALPRAERGRRRAGSSGAADHLDDHPERQVGGRRSGLGWSCPVVWGDRVFLTAVVTDQPTKRPKRACISAKACVIRRSRHPSLDGLLHGSKHRCDDLASTKLTWDNLRSLDIPRARMHPKPRRPTASGSMSCSATWVCGATISRANRCGSGKSNPKNRIRLRCRIVARGP
jgi:hypothetical protein